MSAERPPISFMYVESDIPPGMTIREWRAHRAAERAGRRQAERAARRRQWRVRLLAGALVRAAVPIHPRRARRRTARDSIHGGVSV